MVIVAVVEDVLVASGQRFQGHSLTRLEQVV